MAMNQHISLRNLAVILLLFASCVVAAETPNRVTILYGAFGKSRSLTMDFGFAALLEFEGKRILFDTGNNARIFEHNVKALGVDLRRCPWPWQ
jgi:7,8-dihydropterin-6-yl-methyl-4-(beta-D-ribofuranosyl)aminobenzene 5'-phosphate synthase